MAGGGLRLANLVKVLELSGVHNLHGSLSNRPAERGQKTHSDDAAALETSVRTAVQLLERQFVAM
jgi:copper homeostasis protein CutC